MYDGDEMNVFVPQSIQTQMELALIADIKRQIISPKNSNVCIPPKMDSLLGSYTLTNSDNNISWKDLMNILMYLNIDKSEYENIEKRDYTGHEVFTKIIPNKINIYNKNAKGEKTLDIADGKLKLGTINKNIVNRIIMTIWDRYGPVSCKLFIDNIQHLALQWLMIDGGTVGLGDCLADEQTKEEVKALYNTKNMEVDYLITSMENNPGLMDVSDFENVLMNTLSSVRLDIAKIVMSHIDVNNNFNKMFKSGAKGKDVNIGQIIGGIGQEELEGKRIEKKVNNRTLPHFCQNDDSSIARGCIEHSYTEGLSPVEFFFYTMSGREGLIDTALKTAKTGYISRKLMKMMEDSMVKYDGTIRNDSNYILQFAYGDSNVNQSLQKKLVIDIVKMGDSNITEKYLFNEKEIKELTKNSKIKQKQLEDLNKLTFKLLTEFRDKLRNCFHNCTRIYRRLNDEFDLPVNFNRIIDDVTFGTYHDDTNEKLDPFYILTELNNLIEPTKTEMMCLTNKQINNEKSFKYKDQHTLKTMFFIACNNFLSPKRCIFEYNLTKFKFDKIVGRVKYEFNKAIVEPGEMVGCIAAQSIGETNTQLTLNSVEWNTYLLLKINEIVRKVKIGEFIDDYISKSKKENIEKHPNDTTLSYVKESKIEILSTDENGNVKWEQVEAVTKHLPINEDGSHTLIKVKTLSGREVIATKAKSFLTLNNNKLVPTEGKNIKVGDYLPVSMFNSEVNGVKEERRQDIKKLYPNVNTFNDVYFDKITEITEVISDYPYVYDLTVKNTRNFNLYNGLCLHDTFHFSGFGSSKIQTGVPRLIEILSCTSNLKAPSMSIYLNNKYRSDELMAHKIGAFLKYTTIGDIVKKVEIIYDPDKDGYTAKDNVENLYLIGSSKIVTVTTDFENLSWLMRLVLDRDKLMDKHITMLDIKTSFVSYWNIAYADIKGVKRTERELIGKINQIGILSNNDNSDNPIVHIRFDLEEIDAQILVNFKDVILDKFKIKGIENIDDVDNINQEIYFNYDNENHTPEIIQEYVIYTDGINYDRIKYIDGIDHRRTSTNDIVEINRIFGIEATRSAIIYEVVGALSGNEINYHHLSMLADTITCYGILISIDRHGMNKIDSEPLSKASFEKTKDIFLQAAVFGESDNINSISSRIMTGRAIQGGTGLCEIIMDDEMLENTEYVEEIDKPIEKTYKELTTTKLLDDLISKASFNLFIPK